MKCFYHLNKYQQTYKLFVCNLSHSVLLAKNTAAIFPWDRTTHNFTQRWRETLERQNTRGKRESDMKTA